MVRDITIPIRTWLKSPPPLKKSCAALAPPALPKQDRSSRQAVSFGGTRSDVQRTTLRSDAKGSGPYSPCGIRCSITELNSSLPLRCGFEQTCSMRRSVIEEGRCEPANLKGRSPAASLGRSLHHRRRLHRRIHRRPCHPSLEVPLAYYAPPRSISTKTFI